jgi:uncharacterized protein (TIRG00374 family)
VEVQPQTKGGTWQRLLPGLLISLVTLGAVLYFADLEQLVAYLRQADYRFVLLGLLCSFLWLLVRALAWRALLQDQASYRDTLFSYSEGYLINNLFPFRLGEAARAFLLGRKAHLSFWQVLPTILIERALDLAFAAGLLLVTLPFVVEMSWARPAAFLSGGLVAAGLVVLYLSARNREKALGIFEWFAARVPLVRKLGGRIVPSTLDGLAVLTDSRTFFRALFWITLNWVIAVAQYWLVLAAFVPGPPLLWAMFSLGVAAMGLAAPSAPGGVGVLDAAIWGAFSAVGLDASLALAFSVTIHLIQYAVSLFGVYALAVDGLSLFGLYHRLRVPGGPSGREAG